MNYGVFFFCPRQALGIWLDERLKGSVGAGVILIIARCDDGDDDDYDVKIIPVWWDSVFLLLALSVVLIAKIFTRLRS